MMKFKHTAQVRMTHNGLTDKRGGRMSIPPSAHHVLKGMAVGSTVTGILTHPDHPGGILTEWKKNSNYVYGTGVKKPDAWKWDDERYTFRFNDPAPDKKKCPTCGKPL